MNISLLGRLALALLIFLPSTGQVHKYFKAPGIVVYLFVVLGFALCYPKFSHLFNTRLSRRQAVWLGLLALCVLFAVFLYIHPVITHGSDRDEALNICVDELLAGRYPYHVKTFQGNPPTPLPGSVLLAIPFVLAGTSAYQNFFWLPVFFWRLCVYFGNPRHALLLCATMLCLSPVMLWEILSGSDLLSNNLFVLLFTVEAVRRIPDPGQPLWKKILVSLLLGLCLASRPTFLAYLPLVTAYLAKKSGAFRACRYSCLIGLTFAAITLPFYLYDPAGFTPAHTGNIFRSLNSLFAQADLAIFIILILATLFTIGLTYRTPRNVFIWVGGLQSLVFFWMLVLVLHSGPIDIPIFNHQGVEYLVVPYYHMIGYGVNMQVPGLFALFMAKCSDVGFYS